MSKTEETPSNTRCSKGSLQSNKYITHQSYPSN